MEINHLSLLLSIQTAVQAGLKRHFKAARFHGLAVDGATGAIRFTATVLGEDYVISLQRKKVK